MLEISVQQHKFRLAGLGVLITLGLLIYTTLADAQTFDWLSTDYGLSRVHFQIGYAAALLVVGAVFVFERSIRAELWALGAFGAAVCALLLVAAATAVLIPDQQYRVFRPVPILYLSVAYSIALAAGLLLLALRNPGGAPSKRLSAYAIAVMLMVTVIVMGLHVVSVGRFHPLDDIHDEFMMASNMTSYASDGLLAPSLLNEVYGSPDPVTPRYYVLGGLYLRALGDQSLTALRSWSMIAGVVGTGVMLLVLWRARELLPSARVIGFALLVSSTAFTRTSHNLRMDIGLLTYAALLLLFWLEAERTTNPRAITGWMTAAGLALFIGVEAHLTMALTLGVSTGIILIVLTLIGGNWRGMLLQRILPYAGGAALGCAAYLLIHLTPNPDEQLQMVRLHSQIYVAVGAVVQGFPLQHLPHIFQFHLGLSPIEFFVIVGVMIISVLGGDSRARWLALTAGVALMLQWGLLNSAFNYHITYLPIVVYCAASLMRTRAAVAVIAFVIIPAMAFTTGRDMAVATVENRNGRLIDELSLLDWRIPDGVRVVGSDVFWINLQERTDFIGASGLRFIGNRYDIDHETADILAFLDPDVVICDPVLDGKLCSMADDYFDVEPVDFAITNATYQVYIR
jgi:hypothetical protein